MFTNMFITACIIISNENGEEFGLSVGKWLPFWQEKDCQHPSDSNSLKEDYTIFRPYKLILVLTLTVAFDS